LLTGEYLVLHGASALAVPTRFGQSMEVETMPGLPFIQWTGRILSESWFNAELSLPDLKIIKTNDHEIANNLQEILKVCRKYKPAHFDPHTGYKIRTDLDFDIEWGLGSSSSLLSNLAYWLDTDPFELYFNLHSGSGFDIACARASHPILYRLEEKLPQVSASNFDPPFKDKIYFIYLGRKQNSARSVQEYLLRERPGKKSIDRISSLTHGMSATHSFEEFGLFIREHEEILAGILKKEAIKNSSFPDFNGEIKSLGAWGGDFVMVTWNGSQEDLKDYFKHYGLQVIFPYSELILGRKKSI
jgi:mevalonate kinase